MPWHVIRRIAVAGFLVPGMTWLALMGAQSTGNYTLENVAFWIFAVSYPFWLMLWLVMENPHSTLYFASLIAISLILNASLYAVIGIVFFKLRRLFMPESTGSL
jgi:hypothetical protein